MENNNKKRTGRRAISWWVVVGIITIAFYACMFKFSDAAIGLKWWTAYSAICTLGTLLVNGLLTVTDVKGFSPFNK